MARSCKELHGYDLNPAFVDLARENAAAAGLINCQFGVADARVMQFGLEVYDAAMLSGLLTCIMDDDEVARILTNLSQSLREGSAVLLKDTLHRGTGSRLNIKEGYGAIYRDLATYENLIIESGLVVTHGEWIDLDQSLGSYMMLATRTASK